ncbi:MAG: helix-turn-helix domain-containing protein [Oscillatoriaceae cyanobacterium Prado104]|nr:helix-turn-helix domain-containing protein [Oscillatoriaceae cyanobacterium Prado104]
MIKKITCRDTTLLCHLAVRMGVSASSVRRWEKGDEPRMTVRQMRDFCGLVGVSFDELPDYLSRQVDEEDS